jgi:hypothetical protein
MQHRFGPAPSYWQADTGVRAVRAKDTTRNRNFAGRTDYRASFVPRTVLAAQENWATRWLRGIEH